jgi:hypothetical protein
MHLNVATTLPPTPEIPNKNRHRPRLPSAVAAADVWWGRRSAAIFSLVCLAANVAVATGSES